MCARARASQMLLSVLPAWRWGLASCSCSYVLYLVYSLRVWGEKTPWHFPHVDFFMHRVKTALVVLCVFFYFSKWFVSQITCVLVFFFKKFFPSFLKVTFVGWCLLKNGWKLNSNPKQSQLLVLRVKLSFFSTSVHWRASRPLRSLQTVQKRHFLKFQLQNIAVKPSKCVTSTN